MCLYDFEKQPFSKVVIFLASGKSKGRILQTVFNPTLTFDHSGADSPKWKVSARTAVLEFTEYLTILKY